MIQTRSRGAGILPAFLFWRGAEIAGKMPAPRTLFHALTARFLPDSSSSIVVFFEFSAARFAALHGRIDCQTL
jgi:hypothetical protein